MSCYILYKVVATLRDIQLPSLNTQDLNLFQERIAVSGAHCWCQWACTRFCHVASTGRVTYWAGSQAGERQQQPWIPLPLAMSCQRWVTHCHAATRPIAREVQLLAVFLTFNLGSQLGFREWHKPNLLLSIWEVSSTLWKSFWCLLLSQLKHPSPFTGSLNEAGPSNWCVRVTVGGQRWFGGGALPYQDLHQHPQHTWEHRV